MVPTTETTIEQQQISDSASVQQQQDYTGSSSAGTSSVAINNGQQQQVHVQQQQHVPQYQNMMIPPPPQQHPHPHPHSHYNVHHPIHHSGYPVHPAQHLHPSHLVGQAIPIQSYQPSQLTSLYVGDLAADVNEIILNELFSKVGRNAIASIHVCRDSNTMRSLGYAYVNFFNNHDAERALDTLNYSLIHGKPCRIMWSYRDPTKRKTNVGNIFVKNLEKTVDNPMLYDTFSSFGNILSCKVEFEKGVSKGYGYVHFETNESAEKAIEKVTGQLILGKPIAVERFVPKVERYKVENKVFFRNADESVTQEMIQEELSKFGEIESCILKSDVNGKSKGLGLIEFKNMEDAQKLLASSELEEGITVGGKPITIDRIKSKVERFTEYRKKTTDLSLFINNIDESYDRELIKEEFAKHGTIIGIKIVQDENGKNKGFGFISFSEVSEATKAVEELNGFTFGSKQIQVSFSNKDNQSSNNNKPIKSNKILNNNINNSNIASQQQVPYTGYLPNYNPRYNGAINHHHHHHHQHQHPHHHNPMYLQQQPHHPQYYQQQPQQQQQQPQQAQLNGNINTNNTATVNTRYTKSNGGAPFKKPQNAQNGVPSTNSTKSSNGQFRNNTSNNNINNKNRVPNGKPRYNNNTPVATATTTTPTTVESVVEIATTTTPITTTTTTLTLEFITNATIEEATDALGSEIYSLVLEKYENSNELAAKIAGMIINAVTDPKELYQVIASNQIIAKIEEAKSLLDEHNNNNETASTSTSTTTTTAVESN